MAGNREISKRVLTSEKKQADGLICILWAGEFGHLIMNVMPRVNAMRIEYPNHHIIFASYEGDDIYFSDNNREPTIDEYWAFPWWATDRGCQEVKGNHPKFFTDVLHEFDEVAKDYSDALIYDTTKYSLSQFTEHFKNKNRIAYPLKDTFNHKEFFDTEDHIIIYARAKNYTGLSFRSWESKQWNEFLDMVLDYHPTMKAYVCGIEEESVHFNWSDRIVPVLKGPARSAVTLDLLSNANYCISDCSGSANFALQVGVPTFVSGPPEYEEGFTNTKNYFGTYIHYQNTDMRVLTAQLRFAGLKAFLRGDFTRELKRNFYVFTPPK